MKTTLRKAEDLEIDSKLLKKFESDFKKEVKELIAAESEAWNDADEVIGCLNSGIKHVANTEYNMMIDLEFLNKNTGEYQKCGCMPMQHYENVLENEA